MNYFNPIEILLILVLIVGLIWLVVKMVKNSLFSLFVIILLILTWILFAPLSNNSTVMYHTEDFFSIEAFAAKTKIIYNQATTTLKTSLNNAQQKLLLNENKR